MASLGETLAEERRRRGRTIADVEAATRIRGRLLEALENGRYDELPSSAYVKGYIQSYAGYLEIPSRPLLDQYVSERRLASGEQQIEERSPLDLPADAVVPTRAQAHEMPMRTWATIVAGLAVGGLLLWGVVALIVSPNERTVPAAPLTATETTSAEEPKGTPEKKKDSAPSVETTPAESSEETKPAEEPKAPKKFTLRLAVVSGEASWLKVTVDGLTAYEGTLEGGETKEWRVSDEAHLRIGRPSAVTVTRDGQPVQIRDTGNIGVVDLSASDE